MKIEMRIITKNERESPFICYLASRCQTKPYKVKNREQISHQGNRYNNKMVSCIRKNIFKTSYEE